VRLDRRWVSAIAGLPINAEHHLLESLLGEKPLEVSARLCRVA
jgi:hypothetical protein